MCVNSCVTFTGPFADHTHYSHCREPRYDQNILQKTKGKKKVPQQHAKAMRYREEHTQEVFDHLASNGRVIPTYTDFFNGSDYLNAEHNIVLVFSINGAQLYRFKVSDCWIAIWIIFDCSPDSRYKKKHVLPVCVIPGPKKPHNLDSFLFPGFHHLATLQKEGLKIWDASQDYLLQSKNEAKYKEHHLETEIRQPSNPYANLGQHRL
ncbi:hypothetical protein HYDPIDRAFT_172412 [Hydnomerulius pinastri MD-312]|nr:hypothetical protein HYDPIDRAFT_172412 [Hydnomerulius pinastri MD-312]